jgi:hypothetical protein
MKQYKGVINNGKGLLWMWWQWQYRRDYHRYYPAAVLL